MKKTIRLLIALLILLTLNIAVTSAQPIEPSGEKVGFDAQELPSISSRQTT